MKHKVLSISAMVLGAGLWAGCASNDNEYNPPSTPTNLAAYAAKSQYPVNANLRDNMSLTATVNRDNGQITIRNFGNTVLSNFNLWVNRAYVLHVDRIDPNSSRMFQRSDMYNSGGNNLADTPPSAIHFIQVQLQDGSLWNVQGPQFD